MPERYALFFTIGTSDAESGSDAWRTEMDLVPEVEDPENPSHGIRKIFHYRNMYVCILNDSRLMNKKLDDFTEEEISKALDGKELTEQEKISKVKSKAIIKPIIESILSAEVVDDPNFEFRWTLISLNELKWPEPAPTTGSELIIKKPEGAAGGGSRGG